MKKVIEDRGETLFARDAKDGYIYAAIDDNDIVIIHDLGVGDYGVTSIVLGHRSDYFDEFGRGSLEDIITALRNENYDVFQLESISEFAEWVSKFLWPPLKPKAKKNLRQKVQNNPGMFHDTVSELETKILFNVLLTGERMHALTEILVHDEDHLEIRTACGIKANFNGNGTSCVGHRNWHLETMLLSVEPSRKKAQCRSCSYLSNLSISSPWYVPLVEAGLELKVLKK